MLKINPDQSSSKVNGQKVENDPFDIDVRELRTTSLNKEQTEEGVTILTTVPIAITISITKYSMLLQC